LGVDRYLDRADICFIGPGKVGMDLFFGFCCVWVLGLLVTIIVRYRVVGVIAVGPEGPTGTCVCFSAAYRWGRL